MDYRRALGIAAMILVLSGCSAAGGGGSPLSSDDTSPSGASHKEPSPPVVPFGQSLETPWGPVSLVHIQTTSTPLASEGGTIVDIDGLEAILDFTNTTEQPQQPYVPDGLFYLSEEDMQGADVSDWGWNAIGYADILPGSTAQLSLGLSETRTENTVYLAVLQGRVLQTLGSFTFTEADISESALVPGSVETPLGIVQGSSLTDDGAGNLSFEYSIVNNTDQVINGYCNGEYVQVSLADRDGAPVDGFAHTEIDCPVEPHNAWEDSALSLSVEDLPATAYVYSYSSDGKTLQRHGSFLLREADVEPAP